MISLKQKEVQNSIVYHQPLFRPAFLTLTKLLLFGHMPGEQTSPLTTSPHLQKVR